MKKTTIGVVALALCVLLAALCLTACGENNTKPSETVTEAAAEKATDAAVETSSDAAEAKSDSENQVSGGSVQSDTSDLYAGISTKDAVSKAVAAIGKDDLFADYSEKGEYNSNEAWIITLTDNTGMSYTAYVSSDFCEYVARDVSAENDYAGISGEEAVSKAIAAIGKDDLFADYSEKGEYNSNEAWIITLTDNTGMSYTAYVSSDFCEYTFKSVSE